MQEFFKRIENFWANVFNVLYKIAIFFFNFGQIKANNGSKSFAQKSARRRDKPLFG